MSERSRDCLTVTKHIPAMGAAQVAVEGEVRGIWALISSLQRSCRKCVNLGIQPLSKGEKKMSEMLKDWSTPTDRDPAKQATILLVEDEETVRGALDSFLQRRGYKVITVGTVEEAQKRIKARDSEDIAVIVSDVNLHPLSKEVEGYAFFQRWTAEYPDLHFILISEDHTARDLPAVRSGAARFLAKPFNVYDLLAALQSALTA